MTRPWGQVRSWLRKLTRVADIRAPQSILFLLDEARARRPWVGECPCIVIEVPPEDFAWLAQRPAQFRAAYEDALERYWTHRSLGGRHGPQLCRGVELRCARAWRVTGERTDPSPDTEVEADAMGGGYFVVPDAGGARWIIWAHREPPARPTFEQQEANAADLDCVLTRSRLLHQEGPRWASGEEHKVCGQIVLWFQVPSVVRSQ
jgi:hypothetical protein